jgi:preprotein translocase subunit SecA
MTELQSFTPRWSFSAPRVRAILPAHWELVVRMSEMSDSWKNQSDEHLGERADALRVAVRNGRSLLDEEILVESFALVREASRRRLGMAHYDVQLVAGVVLAGGAVAEMQTGEGKTITAALPAFLRSLAGRGVHVATVNAYLASRDYNELKPVFELLRASIGNLPAKASAEDKRKAYACDVTYGPGYEFGFDYLRDQVALHSAGSLQLGDSFRAALRGLGTAGPEPIQRGHAFAIIDEIDSVLIDEARTPLVLSMAGSSDAPPPEPAAYVEAHRLSEELESPTDFTVDARTRRITVTPEGHAKAEVAWTRIPGAKLHRPWPVYVEQALRAREVLKRDVDYVVLEDKVQIVDAMTGRIFADRTWRDGLHQAVEVKEGIAISPEQDSMARISRQRYFGFYDAIAGMTGTATGNEIEFREFYRLGVLPIPLRRPSQRNCMPNRFFSSGETRDDAVVAELIRLQRTGQPTLVGTRNIQQSEHLAEKLARNGVPHRVLNGKQDEDEAQIVALAGNQGALTIATNMAGRGTDIKLGSGVEELGGLHVVGVERNESRRIDRQLIGRAARQGNPGSCQFFVSAEDELLRDHGPALARKLVKIPPGEGIVDPAIDAEVDRLQDRLEQAGYVQRRNLLRQDNWLEEIIEKLAKEEDA